MTVWIFLALPIVWFGIGASCYIISRRPRVRSSKDTQANVKHNELLSKQQISHNTQNTVDTVQTKLQSKSKRTLLLRRPPSSVANNVRVDLYLILGIVVGYSISSAWILLTKSPHNAGTARSVFVTPLLTTDECQAIQQQVSSHHSSSSSSSSAFSRESVAKFIPLKDINPTFLVTVDDTNETRTAAAANTSSSENSTTTTAWDWKTVLVQARLRPMVERIYGIPTTAGTRTLQKEPLPRLHIEWDHWWIVHYSSSTPSCSSSSLKESREWQLAEDPPGLLSPPSSSSSSVSYLHVRIVLSHGDEQETSGCSICCGDDWQFWNRGTKQPFGKDSCDTSTSLIESHAEVLATPSMKWPVGSGMIHSSHLERRFYSAPQTQQQQPEQDDGMNEDSMGCCRNGRIELVGSISLLLSKLDNHDENPSSPPTSFSGPPRPVGRQEALVTTTTQLRKYDVQWWSINTWASYFQNAHLRIEAWLVTRETTDDVVDDAIHTKDSSSRQTNDLNAKSPSRDNNNKKLDQQQRQLGELYQLLWNLVEALGDALIPHCIHMLVPEKDSLAFLQTLDREFFLLHQSQYDMKLDGTCDASNDMTCRSDHDTDTTRDHSCAPRPEDPVAWKPADLDHMFERIIQTFDHVKVWSCTLTATNQLKATQTSTRGSGTEDADGNKHYPLVGPWIITIDNFISPAEAQHLIDWGKQLGYERSQGVAQDLDHEELDRDGALSSVGVVSADRTSTNTWCEEGCHDDPVVVNVKNRLENLTGIPMDNAELIQLLQCTYGHFCVG